MTTSELVAEAERFTLVPEGDLRVLKQKRERYQSAVYRGEEAAPSPILKKLLLAIDILTEQLPAEPVRIIE